MFEHVRHLAGVFYYEAPAGRTVRPVRIKPGTECVELLSGGEVLFTADGAERRFGKGAIFWHQSGDFTVHRYPPDRPYRCYVFRFAVRDGFRRPGPRVSVWEPGEDAAAFGAAMFTAFHSETERRDVLCNCIYATLAYHALRPPEAAPSGLPPPLRAAIAFLDRNLTASPTVAETAAAAGVSAPYLYALFRAHLRESPHRYLLRQRVELAKLQLAGSRTSIKEIASECGFESLEVFYRRFRAFTGETPARYRDRYAPDRH